MDNIAGWADVPEEPSVVIATGDFNRDGIADIVKATLPDGKDSGQYFLTVQLGRRRWHIHRMWLRITQSVRIHARWLLATSTETATST